MHAVSDKSSAPFCAGKAESNTMESSRRLAWCSRKLTGLALAILCAWLLAGANKLLAQDAPTTSATSGVARPAGTIKAINGKTIILTSDAGAEVTIEVQDAARLVAVAPGQKDLQNAKPIQLQDLQAGDRIVVRGTVGADGKTILANSVLAMKKADVTDRQARDREDWQKNGIGGLVRAVDPASGTITIGVMNAAGSKEVTVRASKSTIVRRYAPDSVQFDKATLSSLDQLKPGDQLRARGSHGAGESDFLATEIVTGSFRNIAGTVSSIDAANGSVQVDDLITKKSIQIRITQESQVRKLPPPMAQRIAMRLKGGSSVDTAAPGASHSGASSADPSSPSGVTGNGAPPSGSTGGRNGADLQQMILRMPPSTLGDFQQGDAVMVVATQGNMDAQATAIILLGGVEPILSSTSKAEARSLLSPWSLSSGGGGDTP
jgi:hypothetical protein